MLWITNCSNGEYIAVFLLPHKIWKCENVIMCKNFKLKIVSIEWHFTLLHFKICEIFSMWWMSKCENVKVYKCETKKWETLNLFLLMPFFNVKCENMNTSKWKTVKFLIVSIERF